MNKGIEISKLIDRYLPADGIGTEREQIRMEMHNDIAMLVKKLHISDVSYTDLTFYGKKITDLTRDELYKGIEWLYNENERYRKNYHDSEKFTLDLMGDLIDNENKININRKS